MGVTITINMTPTPTLPLSGGGERSCHALHRIRHRFELLVPARRIASGRIDGAGGPGRACRHWPYRPQFGRRRGARASGQARAESAADLSPRRAALLCRRHAGHSRLPARPRRLGPADAPADARQSARQKRRVRSHPRRSDRARVRTGDGGDGEDNITVSTVAVPSPLVGEGQGGGSISDDNAIHPPPQPSPSRGEGEESARRCRGETNSHHAPRHRPRPRAAGRLDAASWPGPRASDASQGDGARM